MKLKKAFDMKQFLTILAAVILFTLNAATPSYVEDDPEEIEIYKQHNGNGPTSVNVYSIHAYKTNHSIDIQIAGFTGNVGVVISGLSGAVFSGSQWVNGMGSVILDISNLPDGDYTIFIYMTDVYWGIFRT